MAPRKSLTPRAGLKHPPYVERAKEKLIKHQQKRMRMKEKPLTDWQLYGPMGSWPDFLEDAKKEADYLGPGRFGGER